MIRRVPSGGPIAFVLLVVAGLLLGACGGDSGDHPAASEPAALTAAGTGRSGPKLPPCDRTVGDSGQVRSAVQSASPGKTVCLKAGSYGTIDLRNIDKPADNRVVFRGVGKRKTQITGLRWAGSSGLLIENLRSTGTVDGADQYPSDHLTFRYMNVSSRGDAFRGIGAWDNSGQRQIVIERSFIHDAGEYAIRAQGNAPDWTIRKNRIERVREDFIQTGQPSGWVVDHNVMGPGDFSRPQNYGGHPDLWQSLDSGSDLRFTNNLVKNTNQSLGFIYGAITDYDGYDHVVVRNNVFYRVVYGVGENCQFSPGNGYVFEQNTLIDSRGCRWGGGEGDPWPDGRNYSIKRNVLSGSSFLSCSDTRSSNSCRAFEQGSANNVRGFDKWANKCFFKPKGLPKDVGARLSARDFRGYPFRGSCMGTRSDRTRSGDGSGSRYVLSGIRAATK